MVLELAGLLGSGNISVSPEVAGLLGSGIISVSPEVVCYKQTYCPSDLTVFLSHVNVVVTGSLIGMSLSTTCCATGLTDSTKGSF